MNQRQTSSSEPTPSGRNSIWQTLPIGRYAHVRYRGCEADKWLRFGQAPAVVTQMRQGWAFCCLPNQEQVWVHLSDLERVPPAELPESALHKPGPATVDHFAPLPC